MIDGTYKKVIYYNLSSEMNLQGGGTIIKDVSGYRWPKAFAVRIGSTFDGLNTNYPLISATFYTSAGTELTLTNHIAKGGRTSSNSIINSAQSICGNAATSGFSILTIPNNFISLSSAGGHSLCKGSTGKDSWLWYPYRLIKLTYTADDTTSDTGLLLLF